MSDTLLNYAINHTPNPIQASPRTGNPSTATLALVVSNSTGYTITCKSISLGFLVGTNAEDFCADTTGISTSVPTGWHMDSSGGLFTFTPLTKEAGQIKGQGLSFTLSGINVNQEPGPFTVTITEEASDEDSVSEDSRCKDFSLAKFPAKFEVGELNADPTIVAQGGSTILSWSGSGSSGNYTATYVIEYLDANDNKVTISHPKGEPTQPLPPVGSYQIDNLVNNPTVFYLIVTVQVPGQPHPLVFQRQNPVTVIPPKPGIDYFNIAANPIVSGKPLSFTLSWGVSHVTDFQIVANDGPDGQSRRLDVPFSPKGTYIVFPRQLQTTYTMQVLSGVRAEKTREEEETGE